MNQISSLKYSNFLLDLDGTLIDSYRGIEWAFHGALARVLPACPRVALRELIGPPLPEIFRLYLVQHFEIHADEKTIEKIIENLIAVFREYYEGESYARCDAYPKVIETLLELRKNGARLFIVTNKPALPTALILEHLQWREYFEAVICPDSQTPNFAEKYESTRHVLETLQLAPRETLFVGDSADDATAASENDLDFAAILYGYGAAREYSARYQLQNFSELTMLSGS